MATKRSKPQLLFIGSYRTRTRDVRGLAKELARQWVSDPRTAYLVPLAIHRTQPRRRSVFLAMLVVKELALSPAYYPADAIKHVAALLAAMNPSKKGQTNAKRN